jgi:hypothetical protein
MLSDPKIWGPPLWAEFHRLCRWPTPGTRNTVHTFHERIPCLMCSLHFRVLLGQYPMPLRDQELFAWSVFIHNKVNEDLGKPQVSLVQASQIFS